MTSSDSSEKIIVAGGSSGIGLATAKLLANQRYAVTVTGRDAKKLKEAEQTPGIRSAVVNSADRNSLDEFFKTSGKIDHLVVALSGGKGAGNFADLPLQDLRDGFEGKFWPQLNTVQAALPSIREGGSITLVTAISSVAKLPGTSGLAALNAALETMVPVIAKELKTTRINAVSPGVVDTPWWNFLPPDVKEQTFEQYSKQILLGRVAKPEEIADVILFLIKNRYMTGKVVGCDGGLS